RTSLAALSTSGGIESILTTNSAIRNVEDILDPHYPYENFFNSCRTGRHDSSLCCLRHGQHILLRPKPCALLAVRMRQQPVGIDEQGPADGHQVELAAVEQFLCMCGVRRPAGRGCKSQGLPDHR